MANLLPFNTFVKGIITEANPLTYPENASVDEANFVLNFNGSRQRREGVDMERNGKGLTFNNSFPLSDSDNAIASFEWRNAGQRGDVNILVVQVGNELRFFLSDKGAISNYPIMSTTAWFLAGDQSEPMSFSSVLGRLIVAHGQSYIATFEYDPSSGTLTNVLSPLKVRDTFGVESGQASTFRTSSSTRTDEHSYNLFNMGWPSIFPIKGSADGNPADACYTTNNYQPAESDLFYMFKTASSSSASDIGSFDPSLMDTYSEGSLEAPKGRVLMDLFNRGKDRAIYQTGKLPDLDDIDNGGTDTGGGGNDPDPTSPPVYPIEPITPPGFDPRVTSEGWVLPEDITYGGVSSVAAYAGRAFYAITVDGVSGIDNRSPDLGSMVFFSQVGADTASLTKCYSELDPTAETLNEVLDTDGGYVSIPEAGRIMHLAPMGTLLLIFAENGVWSVGGGDKVFSAKNLAIHKVSNDGLHAREGAITAGDVVMYVSRSGIYRVVSDPVSGLPKAENITETTIQTLFLSIGLNRQKWMRGTYDTAARKVRFLVPDEGNDRCVFELVFDLTLSAWTKYTYPQDVASPAVRGYAATFSPQFDVGQVPVTTTSSEAVVTSTGDKVCIEEEVAVDKAAGLTRHLLSYEDKLYFGETRDSTFKDFRSFGDGYDAPAFMITGYIAGGDTARMKHAPYIVVQAEQTEEPPLTGTTELTHQSNVIAQYMWEWTKDDQSARWGSPFIAYRQQPVFITEAGGSGYEVSTVKRKIRGRGRVLSLKFSTEEEKDCVLLGWTLEVSVLQKM